MPLIAALGWLNLTYPCFAVVEGLLVDAPLPASARRWALPLGTALLATSLDLLVDVLGLDLGLWEWARDGAYVPEIVGPNGRRGIPLGNFAGWLVLASAVPALYLCRYPDDTAASERPGGAGSVEATRAAALLLLPPYLASAAWAMGRGQGRAVAYAALVPLALGAALVRRRDPGSADRALAGAPDAQG